MRRKRGKYTWFPVLGSSFGATPGPDANHVGFVFQELIVPALDITPPTIENGGLAVNAVVPDFTQYNDGTATASLLDEVQGQEYVLKRIVGKIFVSLRQTAGLEDPWPAVIVTCGLLVARALDESQGEIELQDNEVDPNNALNAGQPWIWRRSWKFSNFEVSESNDAGAWPANNSQCGSVLDGPHIDAKVSRRVRREHRLWLASSAFGISPTGLTATSGAAVDINMDIRLLGAMRRGRNESSF